MKITKIFVAAALASLTFVFSSCGDTTTNTAGTVSDQTTTGDATGDATTTAQIQSTVPAEDVGYLYGMIVSKQFANAQLGLAPNEKNIDKFIEGAKNNATNPQAIEAAIKSLQARFGNPQAQVAPKPSATQEEAELVSYNLGINMFGGMIQQLDVPISNIDFDALKEGFQAEEAKSAKFTDAQLDSILKAFIAPYQKAAQAKAQANQAKAQAEMEAKMKVESAAEIEKGRNFLAENGKKEGVTTLPSGLQYEVVKKGTGASPLVSDKVKVHYHGTTIDGNVFDSSVDRGEPISFPLGNLIKGWQEGIPLMKEGAEYRFYVPYDLAYGLNGSPPKIPGGATLIFDVQLIKVNPAD